MSETPKEKKKICGAKTRSGGVCKARPMANGRCRLHGGKSLGGLNSPRLKTGRHSKYLPKNLLKNYQVALNDPTLLQLHDEIALVDARLAQLLQMVDTGIESKEQWSNLQTEFSTVIATMHQIPALSARLTGQGEDNILRVDPKWRGPKRPKKNLEESEAINQMLEALTKLGGMLETGMEVNEAWGKIQEMIEQRRKLVESERKWHLENQQIITAEKALLLIAAIANIIKQNVTDKPTRQTIIADINQLVTAQSD